jgi:TorA maturation chaperone TorD
MEINLWQQKRLLTNLQEQFDLKIWIVMGGKMMVNDELLQLLTFRTKVYNVLRCFYQVGPSEETLVLLKELLAGIEAVDDLPELAAGLAILTDFFQVDYKLDQLELEYAMLLVGPGQTPVIPFESAYGGEGKLSLMREPALNARKIYLEAGLMMEKFQSQPEDYLGAELEFMYYLCNSSLEKLKQAEEGEFDRLVELQDKFLTEHLFNWGEEFAEKLYQNATSKLLKGVAKITGGVLELERQVFSQGLN